jgi:general stress protein 26
MGRADPQNTLDATDRVWTLIDRIPISMLVTLDGQALRARPMSHTARRDENAIYFLTRAETPKEHEIDAHADICLTFADPGGDDFVSLSGAARILNDRELIKALWTPESEAWFDGVDDPEVRALEVTPSEAQYWSGPNALVAHAAMLGAAMTHTKPDLGAGGKVELN